MGFGFSDLGALALAPVTGGGSLILKNQWDKRKNNVGPAPGQTPRDPLMASDVQLEAPLKAPLQGIQKTAQGNLADALGTISGNAAASADASGRIRGDYTGQALGRANTAASSGIDDTLAAILGETSLKHKQSDLGYQDNIALAKYIGELNKPTALEEILAGLGGAADTAGQGAALYQALGKNKKRGLPDTLPPGPNRNPAISETYYE